MQAATGLDMEAGEAIMDDRYSVQLRPKNCMRRGEDMFSLEAFLNTYETEPTQSVIHGHSFTFLRPKSIEGFIDDRDLFRDFPLWAKVWEASYVLIDHLAQMKPDPGKNFLEIGCGIGVVGIAASCFGHDVTMTEGNSLALEFARANAEINQCRVRILELDWNKPGLSNRFDVIVGSEVVYHERDFDPLLGLFRALLKPEGVVILSSEVRKVTVDFYKEMQRFFVLKARKMTLRSSQTATSFILCTMQPKNLP
jgi:2-polyprenyl-3-methyl-5-hydroxy-6-metoxy-1,4-benzoquinol methylase